MASMLLNLLFALSLDSSNEPQPVSWIRPADYPAALISEGKEGTVDFQLTFNHVGRVTICAIKNSSGVVLLDAMTCRISARRAKASENQARVQTFRYTWKVPSS